MAVMYFNVKQGIQTGNVVIDAASGNISNIGNIILVGGTSANLGNLTISNYFRGNGSLLTSITGANVTGYVPNATAANTATSATTAGTVTTAAQPNITSLGTLSGVTLSSNGNISMNGVASQISGGNLVSANYVSGNGSLLTSITGANVTGYVPNASAANAATTAGTVTTNAQPNITSVGTLTDLTVSGNVFAPAIVQNASTYDTRISLNSAAGIVEISANGNPTKFNPSGAIELSGVSQVFGGTFGGSGLTVGTSQTDLFQNRGGNVTVQVGTGGSISKTWTFENGGNLSAPGKITSAGLVSNGVVNFNSASNVSLGNVSNLHIDGGAAGYVLQTDGSGNLTFVSAGSTGIAGANTEVQFNDGGSFGASNTFTFNKGTNTLSVTNYTGNGAGLTSITGANVTGNVDSAIQSNYANTANSVAGANVSGQVGNALIAGTVYTAAQPNITSVGTLSNLSVTGTVTTGNANVTGTLTAGSIATSGAGTGNISGANYIIANYFSGNGSLLTGLTGANVSGQVGNALVAGTVYTAAQPNITSVGTLLGLSITGNIDITGNINATGNLNYDNVTDLVVGDPLIFLGANNTGNLYDLGFVASYTISNTFYHTGLARDATDGTYKLYDQVITEPTTVIDFANGTYAPFKTGAFESTGNILALNANLGNLAIASYFSGNGYYLTGVQSSGGSATTAGTVTTNAQPNITSVGTLTSITLSSNGNISMNGIASQISGANLISANYFSGNGYYLTSVQAAGGNADTAGTVTTNAQPNITSTGTLTGVTIGSNGNISMNGVASQISGANLVSANYVSGTLTTAAQPNITSVGTLSGVTLTTNGNVSMNGSASQISGANLVSANYVSGTLTTAAQPSITSVGTLSGVTIGSNGNISMNGVASQISGANLVSANYVSGTLTTAAQPNITSVGTLSGVTLTTNGNISMNGVASQISGGNLVSANYVSGTLTTASQPSITSVGTLSGVTIGSNGNISMNGVASQISGGNLVSANYVSGTLTTAAQPNITSVGNLSILNVTGNVSAGNIKSDNLLYANGSPYVFTTNAAGSNTQVQFNDNNAFAGSTAFTFDKASNTLTVGSIATTGAGTGNISGANYVIANYFSGNGSLLTSLTGANVTGYVPNATAANTAISATTAGTVTTNAQPNITSVGTLSNLSVTGTVTTGSVSLTNGLTSNRSNVSVTTNTVIDQFVTTTYRTAKYIVSASGDHGYQSIETLLVHDGSSSYITIYGSVCSNVSADIVELSSNVNGITGNVTMYATSASPNAKVNVVVTYINT
jgi:hypothetical protein